MNAMMAETLNISGALLVKLFGRRDDGSGSLFAARGARARHRRPAGGDGQPVLGAAGRRQRDRDGAGLLGRRASGARAACSPIGTIVAFAAYLGQLYGPMQYLIDVPIEFSTSMVSFERVFEIIDLPVEIEEKPDARRTEARRRAIWSSTT